MSRLLIKNASLVQLDTISGKRSVLCENGKIVRIFSSSEEMDGDFETIDARGNFLAPGFIDLHIHGNQTNLLDNGTEALKAICKILPQYGVTSFLPTLCPRPKGEDAEFLASLALVKTRGTQILGFHLEGPFLTLTGALPKEALGQADPERLKALISAAAPYRTIFSVAPDFESILDLIPIMAHGDTPVFMTHTAANVRQTQEAINAGVRHATHFYDVFPAPEEDDPGVRQAGVIEAVLADPRVSVDFILDGEHVDPIVVKMALQCKGPDRVCLITDANIGAGSPAGRYNFGGHYHVIFARAGGPARIAEDGPDPGNLSGSGLTMDLAVRNAIEMLDVDLPLAVRMASANPARVVGVDSAKGQIKEGYDADFVLLDTDLKVTHTWIGAKLCYEKA